MPEMRRVAIRFGRFADAVIAEEAEREGVSFSQFVREAALMRAVVYGLAAGEGLAFESFAERDAYRAGIEIGRLARADSGEPEGGA